jgi:hypothetical protein
MNDLFSAIETLASLASLQLERKCTAGRRGSDWANTGRNF